MSIPQTSAEIPPPPDAGKWDDAAAQFQMDLLSKVQASASVWSGAIAALLGLFGSVALVTGPNDISKIQGNTQYAVLAMTIAAGLLAGIALVLAAIAQQLPSVKSDNWRGSTYRAYVVRKADNARIELKVARLVAAVLIFAVGATGLIYGAINASTLNPPPT